MIIYDITRLYRGWYLFRYAPDDKLFLGHRCRNKTYKTHLRKDRDLSTITSGQIEKGDFSCCVCKAKLPNSVYTQALLLGIEFFKTCNLKLEMDFL